MAREYLKSPHVLRCFCVCFAAHVSVVDNDAGESGDIQCQMKSGQFELQQLYQTEFKIVTSALFDRERQEVCSTTCFTWRILCLCFASCFSLVIAKCCSPRGDTNMSLHQQIVLAWFLCPKWKKRFKIRVSLDIEAKARLESCVRIVERKKKLNARHVYCWQAWYTCTPEGLGHSCCLLSVHSPL